MWHLIHGDLIRTRGAAGEKMLTAKAQALRECVSSFESGLITSLDESQLMAESRLSPTAEIGQKQLFMTDWSRPERP